MPHSRLSINMLFRTEGKRLTLLGDLLHARSGMKLFSHNTSPKFSHFSLIGKVSEMKLIDKTSGLGPETRFIDFSLTTFIFIFLPGQPTFMNQQ